MVKGAFKDLWLYSQSKNFNEVLNKILRPKKISLLIKIEKCLEWN
jgi:hypothetical protein